MMSCDPYERLHSMGLSAPFRALDLPYYPIIRLKGTPYPFCLSRISLMRVPIFSSFLTSPRIVISGGLKHYALPSTNQRSWFQHYKK